MPSTLIKALQQPNVFPHSVEGFEVIETHISWIILTGQFAYKIKKSVNLGFVDFTSLEKRKDFCEKEVLLNQRLAPELYLGVVPITGSDEAPSLSAGMPIEYAIKMHQFSQDDLLNHLVKKQGLSLSIIDSLATQVAHFHQQAERCDSKLPYGTPDDLFLPMQDNFAAIANLPASKGFEASLESFKQWTEREVAKLKPLLEKRKSNGWIRACHGDLHLGNMVLMNNKPVIFDCIEFNERFRWIDVMNDVGFLMMDLDHFAQAPIAHYFINRYCEITNDYEGVQLIRFYQCYRAMVRAKISAFQLQLELTNEQAQALKQDFVRFLTLATHYTRSNTPSLTITMGLSGSGKSYASEKILMKTGAIRLRSDIFRKKIENDRYSDNSTKLIYEALAQQAESLLKANYPVIIDAACLKQWQRELFLTLATRLKVPFHILALDAPLDVLRQRIKERQTKGDDPSEASADVLELQLKEQEPLTDNEKIFVKDLGPAR